MSRIAGKITDQIIMYWACRNTRERIEYLLSKAINFFLLPIRRITCRVLGHGKLWITDGWPYPNTRLITCSRCLQAKLIEKDKVLEPRFIIYDLRTKAFIKIQPLPEPLVTESVNLPESWGERE